MTNTPLSFFLFHEQVVCSNYKVRLAESCPRAEAPTSCRGRRLLDTAFSPPFCYSLSSSTSTSRLSFSFTSCCASTDVAQSGRRPSSSPGPVPSFVRFCPSNIQCTHTECQFSHVFPVTLFVCPVCLRYVYVNHPCHAQGRAVPVTPTFQLSLHFQTNLSFYLPRPSCCLIFSFTSDSSPFLSKLIPIPNLRSPHQAYDGPCQMVLMEQPSAAKVSRVSLRRGEFFFDGIRSPPVIPALLPLRGRRAFTDFGGTTRAISGAETVGSL